MSLVLCAASPAHYMYSGGLFDVVTNQGHSPPSTTRTFIMQSPPSLALNARLALDYVNSQLVANHDAAAKRYEAYAAADHSTLSEEHSELDNVNPAHRRALTIFT